mgnify:CR=1 FL=1
MKERLTRRELLRFAGLGSMVALLASCAPKVVEVTKVVKEVVKETIIVAGTPQVVEKIVTVAPAPSKPATIETWDFGGSEFEFIDSAMIPEFNIQYPHITIKHVGIPEDGYWTKVRTTAAAGKPPDVFVFADRKMCKQGVVLGLNDMLDVEGIDRKKDYPQGVLHNYCMIDDDVVYKMPTMAALWAGCYNKTLFEENGVTPLGPNDGYDFEDWYNMAKAINKPSEDINKRIWGTDMVGLRYNNNVPKFAGEDGRTVVGNIDSEGWINMYKWRARIWKEELTPYGDVGRMLGGSAFALGKIGISQEDYAPLLKHREKGVDAVVSQFPKFPKEQDNAAVVGWSDCFSGSKATKELDAVLAWLKYLGTDGAMTRSHLTHYPPMYLPYVEQMDWPAHNIQGPGVMELLMGMPIYPFNPGVTEDPMEAFWTRITEGGEEIEPLIHEMAKEEQKELDKVWEEWEKLGK